MRRCLQIKLGCRTSLTHVFPGEPLCDACAMAIATTGMWSFELTTPLIYFSMSGALNSRLRSARLLGSSFCTPMLDSCRKCEAHGFGHRV